MEITSFLSAITAGRVCLALLAYCVFSAIYQILYYRFFHPLRVFPGPFWGSVTRLWIAYHNWKEDERFVAQDLHKKYGSFPLPAISRFAVPLFTSCHVSGPVIRITPTLLLVTDYTKLPDIYNRYANKSKHYITGSFGETESLFNMQDSRVHASFRKYAAPPVRNPHVKMLVQFSKQTVQLLERQTNGAPHRHANAALDIDLGRKIRVHWQTIRFRTMGRVCRLRHNIRDWVRCADWVRRIWY